MSWLQKLLPSLRTAPTERKKNVPEGLWTTCNGCSSILYHNELERNLMVCPRCNYHFRLNGRQRLEFFLDPGHRVEIATEIGPVDMLRFRDSKRYKDRLTAAQKETNEKDALIAFQGSVLDLPVVAVAFDFNFIGGSMGSVVGEKFVQAATRALEQRMPFICFSASGGARMQEAAISLMQMAKTSAALAKLAKARLPYVSVLTDPTYGGVSASLAMLGDINIAEPKAMIGFTGPRVIEQTVRTALPEGFQQAEFLVEHGFVDMILQRSDLREKIATILKQLMHNKTDK